jgi:hypothetical protein
MERKNPHATPGDGGNDNGGVAEGRWKADEKTLQIDQYRATSEKLSGEGQKLGQATSYDTHPSAIAAPSKSLVVSPPSLWVEYVRVTRL